MLTAQGASAGEGGATEAEESLRRDGDDIEARLRLIGYRQGKQRASHLLYLIERHPELPLGPLGTIPTSEPDEHLRGKISWLDAVRSHPRRLVIANNAASYLIQSDAKLGLSCLLGAPQDMLYTGKWASSVAEYLERCGRFWQGDDLERAACAYYRGVVQGTLDRDALGHALWGLRSSARRRGDRRALRLYVLAFDILGLRRDSVAEPSPAYEAVARGLVALADGDAEASSSYLNASVIPASQPPPMVLASELLIAGQRTAVEEFLEQCAAAWPKHAEVAMRWVNELRSGGTPVLRSLLEDI
jgi:hypothetical protein